MDEKLKNNGIIFVASSISIVIYFHLAYISTYNESGLIFGGMNFNIIAYIGAFVLSSFMILLFYIVKCRDNKYINDIKKVIYIVYTVGVLIFLYLVYKTEVWLAGYAGSLDSFPRWSMAPNRFIIIMLGLVSILFVCTCKVRKIGNIFRCSFAVMISLGCAILTYVPSIFMYKPWEWVYHPHAYTNSIINIARFAPYDDIRSSIYGHYGLIYLPFVKLFGDDFRAVAITIAIFTFLTFFCVCYIVNSIISHDALYAIIVLAIGAVRINYFSVEYAVETQYFQILPHRYFFVFAMLAFLVWQMGVTWKK